MVISQACYIVEIYILVRNPQSDVIYKLSLCGHCICIGQEYDFVNEDMDGDVGSAVSSRFVLSFLHSCRLLGSKMQVLVLVYYPLCHKCIILVQQQV